MFVPGSRGPGWVRVWNPARGDHDHVGVRLLEHGYPIVVRIRSARVGDNRVDGREQVDTTDFVDVTKSAEELGCNIPTGLALLPRNVATAVRTIETRILLFMGRPVYQGDTIIRLSHVNSAEAKFATGNHNRHHFVVTRRKTVKRIKPSKIVLRVPAHTTATPHDARLNVSSTLKAQSIPAHTYHRG